MKLPNLKLFNRKFISLVISPQHLKAIQINTKSNTLVKSAQIEIPPGVIVNYRVKDKDTLVNLIKDLWKRNRISEKYVGVVVPEFATYTKTLELPNLTDSEMQEALMWSIQEHLPVPVEDVIFDWKVIKREKDKARVLTVAILKEVLFNYIDAVAQANLSPLVVETPSLSIQRIIDKDDIGKLIIYVSVSDAILVITSKKEIVASSVVTTGKFENIVATAHQMLTHYSSASIEKVMISGVGLTQDLVQFLNYNLGRTVQYADISVKGMAPAQVQDYLIGISLQHKDPVEPASDLTVNLLPPAWANYYKKQSLGIREWSLTLIVSVVVWATFLTTFMAFSFLSLEADNLNSSVNKVQAEELNRAATEVKNANLLADTVIAYKKNYIYPHKIINLLASSVVDGVTPKYYKVNYENGEIIVQGNAATRSALLAYRESLEKHEEFGEVSLPINNLVPNENIDFEIRFTYKDLVPKARTKVKLQP